MELSSRLLSTLVLSIAFSTAGARADETITGPTLVRLLGDRAQHVFAPNADTLGALVTLPKGVDAKALGLEPFVAGYGRLHARPADLLAYADAHPDLTIEVAPPLHSLLNQAGQWIHSTEAHKDLGVLGTGVLVGVADTGLDVTLSDFKDPATGKSRVAWILDLSLAPQGLYPELEQKFCVKNSHGTCVTGAVLQGKDIDAMNPLTDGGKIPTDTSGHGTHVTSIAAGNGGAGGLYVGGAPNAQIVFARVTRDVTESFILDDVLTGVSFLFDRAAAMNLPMAANLSLGTDFGPHDGSMSWEKALASFVGSDAPGHALIIAAGNSGSIAYSGATSPIHQVVHVTSGGAVSVPINALTPPSGNGEVDVWVTFTGGSSLSVGLDGPDGTWISPVPNGQNGTNTTSFYNSSIVNGSTAPGSEVASGSNGAVVIWTGAWPTGTYAVKLEGEGTADLWMQASSGVTAPNEDPLGFAYGVREGTINLPATQASLISVGCTVSRTQWTSISGLLLGEDVTVGVALDDAGGLPVDGSAPFTNGEICYFSSAGPNVLGVPKPEISAPGAYVIGAMSTQAPPSSLESIFYDSACPADPSGGFIDPRCLQVDSGHAVAEGTSMSAPMVTGAVALMFERNPMLTEPELVPILQGGAHRYRTADGFVPFEDQGGPGELDIIGSFQAMDDMSDPTMALPAPCASSLSSCPSWISLSSNYLLADGSTPTVAVIELRNETGEPADLFEPSRLAPSVNVDGLTFAPEPTLLRRGPGVWTYSVTPQPGFGGQAITFGASFDGVPIVVARTIPIATDPWTAAYASSAMGSGSCGVASGTSPTPRASAWASLAALCTLLRARRKKTRLRVSPKLR